MPIFVYISTWILTLKPLWLYIKCMARIYGDLESSHGLSILRNG